MDLFSTLDLAESKVLQSLKRAVSPKEALLKAFEGKIEEIGLVPSGGGRFKVSVNGDLIYSKLATGRHADPDEIITSVR